MLREIFVRLWQDESGAVIATEYLMLGTVVAVGSATGLAAMRDGVAEEFKEFGQSVHQTRQTYAVPGSRGSLGSSGGSAAVSAQPAVPTVAQSVGTVNSAPLTAQNAQLALGCP